MPPPEQKNISPTSPRILLLSPPSLPSHPEKLSSIHAAHDRSTTDIQMLDRLSLGLVSLPADTYNEVVILADADDVRRARLDNLGGGGKVLGTIVAAMKPGGNLSTQDGNIKKEEEQAAILAGLFRDQGSRQLRRPVEADTASVSLRLGTRNKAAVNGGAVASAVSPQNGEVSLNPSEKRKVGGPAGVGFSDDPGEEEGNEDGMDSDDELIDEDMLLSEEDMARPIAQRMCAL